MTTWDRYTIEECEGCNKLFKPGDEIKYVGGETAFEEEDNLLITMDMPTFLCIDCYNKINKKAVSMLNAQPMCPICWGNNIGVVTLEPYTDSEHSDRPRCACTLCKQIYEINYHEIYMPNGSPVFLPCLITLPGKKLEG